VLLLPPPVPEPEVAGGRAGGRPWHQWQIAGWGSLVYDESGDSMGAHCNVPGHGICRANKVLKRHGLGYLTAWLRAGHRAGVVTRLDHKNLQSRLMSEFGLDERSEGRKYLTDRPVMFRELLDLERKHNPSLEEPFKVKK
jgi:hypothetical protein